MDVPMFRRSGVLAAWLGLLAVTAGSGSSGAARAIAPPFDPIELQQQFAGATDLKVIAAVAQIPPDGVDKLDQLGRALAWPSLPLADVGMEWSFEDAQRRDHAWGQHRFSAVSPTLIATVFVIGGRGAHYYVFLAPRNSTTYCAFKIEPLAQTNMRLSVVQQLLRPDRDQTISKTPVCHIESLNEPFKLPS